MNKSDLIGKVATSTGVSQADTEKVINGFLAETKSALVAGDKVQLIGFGSFEKTTRAAHTGRNPRTGESIQVAESHNVKFTVGGPLKDAVNGK
jgi:DNA-binding protein HU-beta